MANDKRPTPPQGGGGAAPAKSERARDVERMAAAIYAPLAAGAAARGKTLEAVAAEALAAARAFYRALDDQPQ